MPERSFRFGRYQFPVCARCTGVVSGQILMGVHMLLGNPPGLVWYILFLAIMLVDWLLQRCGIRPSTNLRRFITGAFAGYGLIGIYYEMITVVIRIF